METGHATSRGRRLDRRQVLRGVGAGALAGTIPGLGGAQSPTAAVRRRAAFDLGSGNACVEVVIPRVIPAIFGSVSADANDATLVLRVITLLTNSWFDAIAPYSPTAVGVCSSIGRRPPAEATVANKNVAILHASKAVLDSVLPGDLESWREMLRSVDLDPDDDRVTPSDPVGIGNRAGRGVVAARERDGMNQLGDEGDRHYNPRPYADYLGYEPANSADELREPGRWQPQTVRHGVGLYRTQRFATPQLRVTTAYTFSDPSAFEVAPPTDSDPGSRGYRRQVDEVLAASAALTDTQKMIAEVFDNKILGLGFSALFAAQSRGLGLDEFVHYDFMTNLAAFDTAIAVWHEKHRHDAVRPISAVAHVYGDRHVTAWGGPGKGTVTDLPANRWRGYLNSADHPEFPSGSSAFCAAHAQASRLYFGSDDLGWSVPVPKGSSRFEPGVTPATDITLGPFVTWTQLAEECGMSRLWGGVHFRRAIEAGLEIGEQIGTLAHDFVQAHVAGDVD